MEDQDILKQLDQHFAKLSTNEIKQFIKQAKERAAIARRASTKAGRARETKRLILDGKLLADLIERNIIDGDMIKTERDKFLTRNIDRALFDLPEIEEVKRRGRPPKDKDDAAQV